ncbi:MAG TPA: GNAT family N-acetyltransferase [Acidimicrobiales bacterium]|nr:GNAT family N-acetyltransferase [Acidimicrobiales bacterium]
MATVRRATAADAPFLQQVLAIAADWRPDARVRTVAAVMADPALAHYVAGWPAPRDVGFVVEDDRPLGAAWWRFFTEQDPGYGFVDPATPEISIGVTTGFRRRGLGTALLEALVDEARHLGVPALSLSVETGNPARSLYQRLGFVTRSRAAGSLTMILKLTG